MKFGYPKKINNNWHHPPDILDMAFKNGQLKITPLSFKIYIFLFHLHENKILLVFIRIK